MKDVIHYSQCPVCSSTELKDIFSVKDFSVTGELFQIVECESCDLRFTQDAPIQSESAPYYKSENYISHTDTSKGLINRLYRLVRKSTLRKKRKLVQNVTRKRAGNLLDIGSGVGAFIKEMTVNGWQVTGLEPDEGARNVAASNFNVQLQDINEFNCLEPNRYDAITLWHVLEHVHDLHTYIEKFRRLLKEDGVLFIAVPNYTSLDGRMYKEYWAAYDVPRHLYHFSPKPISTLMELHNLKLTEMRAMWYDSFYISLLSSRYKSTSGKANLAAAFFNGLRSNVRAIGKPQNCSSIIYIITK